MTFVALCAETTQTNETDNASPARHFLNMVLPPSTLTFARVCRLMLIVLSPRRTLRTRRKNPVSSPLDYARGALSNVED
jgi:hypothetical protein